MIPETIAALALALSPAPSAATAKPAPAILIFGGGWGPEGTQASIEAHVDALKHALQSRKPRILFASGEPHTRVVQIPAKERDETADVLGLLFDRRDNLGVGYRPMQTKTDRAASKSALLEALEQTAGEPGGTIVFGAGHGTGDSEDERASLELWGTDDRLSVTDLARNLEAHNRAAPIAFVLGQCHSGAFTDLTYPGGDPKKRRLAQPTRCVLAAVPRDREAAGCTPDVDDAHARAYLALIAEAFEKVKDADYDGDGRITLAEAHAYARIHDETVDLPVSSSELWLKSLLGSHVTKASGTRLHRLVEKARPAERAVLTRLKPSASDEDGPEIAAREIEELKKRSDHLEIEIDALRKRFERIRRELVDRLLAKWPELANPYHRESRRLLAGDATEVMEFLRGRKEINELTMIDDAIQDNEDDKLEVAKRVARLERWLNAMAAVANEEALRRNGARRDVEALERLLACEAMAP